MLKSVDGVKEYDLTQFRRRTRRDWRNGRVLHDHSQHYSPSIASGTIFVHIIKKIISTPPPISFFLIFHGWSISNKSTTNQTTQSNNPIKQQIKPNNQSNNQSKQPTTNIRSIISERLLVDVRNRQMATLDCHLYWQSQLISLLSGLHHQVCWFFQKKNPPRDACGNTMNTSHLLAASQWLHRWKRNVTHQPEIDQRSSSTLVQV